MSDAIELLRIELVRLCKLIEEVRAQGHEAFATLLEGSVAALVTKIADLHTPPSPATQQQQQIQPDKDEPKGKEKAAPVAVTYTHR